MATRWPGFGRALVHARVHAPWRRALPNRSVRRRVQGTELWLPWSHRLPDYVHVSPDYGRNLVELAAALAAEDPAGGLQVVDVGANVGDSTKQIIDRTPATVLAVEADPFYLTYLERNVGGRADVTIAPLLLTTDADSDVHWQPSRQYGTTQFRHDAGVASGGHGDPMPSVRVSDLPGRYPDFANVRLVKSDTDGYDTRLVPELAAAWASSRPVLFFEFDPRLTAVVSDADAHDVWDALAALGYDRLGLWGNDGTALRASRCAEARAVVGGLLGDHGRPAYLDVAAVHTDDEPGHRALDAALTLRAGRAHS